MKKEGGGRHTWSLGSNQAHGGTRCRANMITGESSQEPGRTAGEDWVHRHPQPARALCAAGVPVETHSNQTDVIPGLTNPDNVPQRQCSQRYKDKCNVLLFFPQSEGGD